MTHPFSATELRLSYDAMLIGILALVALSLAVFPRLWDVTVARMDRGRIHTLDGARGCLSIWVLSAHLLGRNAVDAHGVWHPTPGALGNLMASGFFVAPFFMLTGMLFGARLMLGRGKLDTVSFLIKRAFRIAPAYLVAVALLVIGALAASHFHLRVAPLTLLKQVVRWSLFDFVPRYDIDGVDMAHSYGVMWTLRYEIIFYLLVPCIAFLQRLLKGSPLPLLILPAAGFVAWPFWFLSGGLVAAFLAWRLRGRPASPAWQVAAFAGLIAITVLAAFGITDHLAQSVLLVPSLVCLATSATITRPFAWRPFRLVGEVSYSNYVLHGAMLYLLGERLVDFGWLVSLPFLPRTVCLSLLAFAVLASALLCFVLVEQPCIRLGAALTRRLAAADSTSDRAAFRARRNGQHRTHAL